MRPEVEWHSRGYLPHWEAGEHPQSISFRLADSLPAELLNRWAQDLKASECGPDSIEQRRRYEEALDKGHGEALLTRPDIGSIVPHALSAIVHSWKSFTALRINRTLGRHGMLWFPEYFDRRIRDESHFERALHYIETNAVTAGLWAQAEDWPHSSAARST
ncbi:transposase [Labrys sp. KB_33_2]|uniref:transposase n=1 Tax=Labrys sp. KB_33_2 TaxID=3237479 RepID=UPI003F92EA07